MFKHTLLLIFRNFKRSKKTFFINLIGLSTGLACALLIYLWVNDELNFDKFHEKDSRLFQVMETHKDQGEIIVSESTQGPLAEAMLKDLPEIEAAVPVSTSIDIQLASTNKIIKGSGMFAGKDFFNVFSFKLIQGNKQKALSEKNGIVISENLAISLFGSARKAIGKTIDWEFIGKKRSIVSGVFSKPGDKSSLDFDFVWNYDLLIQLIPNLKGWNNEPFSTYIVLKNGTDVDRFNQKISNLLSDYQKQQSIFSLFVRPYSSAYLYGKYENGVQTGGRIEYVKTFSIIAILILVIACINFMNLATARASRRLKEVGIKKTIGATRPTLIIQFLGEAIFTAFLSLILAVIIVVMVLPFFSSLTGKQLTFNPDGKIIAITLGVTLIIGVLSGSYPAFYLSKFDPVLVLKGKLHTSISELFARKGLVIFQFAISLVLIVSVLVTSGQMDYIQSKNIGYNKSNVIQFDINDNIRQSREPFLEELKKIPGIENASTIQTSVVQNNLNSATYGISWPGKKEDDLTNFGVLTIDDGLIKMLGIHFAEGRDFSGNFGSDSTKLIFNETAIKAMGLKNPIGTTVRMWGKDMDIVGVVKDFHILSLHEAIAPLVFRYNPQQTNLILGRITAGKEKETLQSVEALYKKFSPGFVFDYKFLDDDYQALYVSEKRISTLSIYFAGLAILISCLGLFGLAAFNAEIRTKEIGIRKVLGASVNNLMVMLSKDFVKLVLVATLIAFPLAWWMMNKWLHGFVYRIEIQWWMFALAGCAAMLVALVTVSFQALKVAVANPIKSLRTE